MFINKIQKKHLSNTIKACFVCSLPSVAIASMDTMVVTASGYEQQVKQAPASISVITPQELAKKPYRDVTDAIKDIPGVNISGSGDKTDIQIRGMDAKYTLILVDGKRVSSREARPNSDGSGFEQGWLPPLSIIERVEVVRGPMSALYGSDAMGGVINIITKKVSDEWAGNIRLESIFQEDSKSSNYYNSAFSLMGPLVANVLGIQLYGQYSNRDEDKYLNGHAEQKLRSINGKIALNATENQLFELDFDRSLQNSYSTLNKTLIPSKNVKTDSRRDNRRNNISLTHKGNWDSFSSTTFISYEGSDNPVRDMKIENTEFNTQFLIPIENHLLTVGGKYSYQELNDNGNELITSLSKIDRWDYALFAEDEWMLHDDFSLTLGLRYSKDENYGSHWNPRIYGVYNINENYTLKGGYSSGYTTPLLRHVVSDWGQITGKGSGMIIGNPALKPEKSDNIELTLAYDNDAGLNASVTAFYTKFKDKIQSYYICNTGGGLCVANGKGFDFIQSRENVDKADIKGVELSFKTPLWERVKLTSNYTWMQSEQKSGTNQGLALNRTPKHSFNSQVDWMFNEKLDFWAKMNFHGKEIETSTKSGKKQGYQYASYTLWDLGGSYAINKETKLYAGIYNLFDKKVNENDFGKTYDGRRYWVGVDIGF